MKTCFKCLTAKPLSEFYKHAQMGDGHLNKCKDCAKKDALAHRLAKIDHYRSYDKMRASQPHRKALAKRVQDEWKVAHPNRRAANAFKAPEFAKDPTDGSAFRPHRVNPKNGMYRGRQVLNVEV